MICQRSVLSSNTSNASSRKEIGNFNFNISLSLWFSFVFSVENSDHCDFTTLRNMIVRTHMQDLKDVTNTVHYENYRCAKLAGVSSVSGDATKMAPSRYCLLLHTPCWFSSSPILVACTFIFDLNCQMAFMCVPSVAIFVTLKLVPHIPFAVEYAQHLLCYLPVNGYRGNWDPADLSKMTLFWCKLTNNAPHNNAHKEMW